MTSLYFVFGLSTGAVIVATLAHFRISYLQSRVNALSRLFFWDEGDDCNCEVCKRARGESA